MLVLFPSLPEYCRLLEFSGDFWRLLESSEGFWRLLEVSGAPGKQVHSETARNVDAMDDIIRLDVGTRGLLLPLVYHSHTMEDY